MDSTPTPTPTPISIQPQTQPISIKSSARKLPVKRKNPIPNTSALVPKLELPGDYTVDDDDETDGGDRDLPPFKYHRIWTEPDEIRFLQGLLDCSTDNLVFPRDLHIFYARFSQTMSLPYTKSQLYEKLRRLRKKFRVISARLARGVDFSVLSSHDRALFEISKKLWHHDFESISPFGKIPNSNDIIDNKKRISTGSGGNSSLVGVGVSFSPTLPLKSSNLHQIHSSTEAKVVVDDENGGDVDGDFKKNAVNIDYDFDAPQEVVLRDWKSCSIGGGGKAVGNIAAKSVFDVFDEALKEVRKGFVHSDNVSSPADGSSSSKDKAVDFEKRWQEQRVAELDVLARRWRLVLENSLNGK